MKPFNNPFHDPSHVASPEPNAARQEDTLRVMLADAYAAPDAPPELRRRVTDMAALRDQQMVMTPAHRSRPLLALLACGLFTLLMGAYFVGPHLYAALTLRRIQSAMLHTRTAHITTWRVLPDGTRVNISEIWNEYDMWRIEQDAGRWLEARDASGPPLKRGWGYPVEQNSLALMRAFRPLGLYRLNGFSLLDSPDSISRRWMQYRMKWLGENTELGPPLNLYSWQETDAPRDRLAIWVDPKTDLPVYARAQHQNEYEVWKTTAEISYQFNAPISPLTFAYPHPPGPEDRRQEATLSSAQWRAKLNVPIAQTVVNGKTLAIRDLRVNAHGDVFLLYTLDSGSGWHINEPQSLTDDHGNTYLRVFSEPLRPAENVWGSPQKFPSKNSENLKAAWWIPLHPLWGGAKAWKPTRFTITMRTGDAFYGFQNKPWTQTVKFSIPVYDADASLMPPYVPRMAMFFNNVLPEQELLRTETQERTAYYQKKPSHLPQRSGKDESGK